MNRETANGRGHERQKKWGRCPACGKGLVHLGEANILDWKEDWNAVAVQFVCPNGHLVLLVPAAPVLQAQEEAKHQEAEIADQFRGL